MRGELSVTIASSNGYVRGESLLKAKRRDEGFLVAAGDRHTWLPFVTIVSLTGLWMLQNF